MYSLSGELPRFFFFKKCFIPLRNFDKNKYKLVPTHLNVYLIPGLGAVNINESSPRDQSSAALKAMHLPCKSLRLLVKLQPTLQYKYAGTVIVPCFAIVASSQKALLPKERLDAIWWEISI